MGTPSLTGVTCEILKWCWDNLLFFVGDLRLSCVFTLVSLKHLDEVPANGITHTSSIDQATSSSVLKPGHSDGSPEKRGGAKEVAFDVGDSRRSSNSVYAPNESESEEDEASEQEMGLLDDTSRIPRYKIDSCMFGEIF